MHNNKPLRVLVIDDSALYRKIVREVLDATPDVEVVGTASNGVLGLTQIKQLRPDVVTLDFEMPQLDGIGVLKQLAGDPQAPLAIMVSAFTTAGAKSTTAALQEGAFDFVLKPATNSLEQSIEQLRRDLGPKLSACRVRLASGPAAKRLQKAQPKPPTAPVARPLNVRPSLIGIAISTGGPRTLADLLPKLPGDLPCPVVIVQHMPPMFTASLATDLNRHCALEVVEGLDGMPLNNGVVVIAPGGKQMRIAGTNAAAHVEITNDPPERNCKPAADYLFRSIASTYGPKSLGLVLTGMGDDGTAGAREIKQAGGAIIAQDEASCVVYGMPRSVANAGLVDVVLPLNQIADKVTQLAKQGALR